MRGEMVMGGTITRRDVEFSVREQQDGEEEAGLGSGKRMTGGGRRGFLGPGRRKGEAYGTRGRGRRDEPSRGVGVWGGSGG